MCVCILTNGHSIVCVRVCVCTKFHSKYTVKYILFDLERLSNITDALQECVSSYLDLFNVSMSLEE